MLDCVRFSPSTCSALIPPFQLSRCSFYSLALMAVLKLSFFFFLLLSDFILGSRISLFFLESFSHSSKNEKNVHSKPGRMVTFSGGFTKNPNIFFYLTLVRLYKVKNFLSLFVVPQIQNRIHINVPGKFCDFHYSGRDSGAILRKRLPNLFWD